MSLPMSEQITPLQGGNADESHNVKVEDTFPTQILHSEDDSASSSTVTPGHALPSIGKRKERDGEQEKEVKNEVDSDATTSSNEDGPHAKKRRVGSNAQDLNEEPQTDAERTSENRQEIVPAIGSGESKVEDGQDGQGDATSTGLPAEGGPVSAKKRRLSDDSERRAIKQQIPTSTVDAQFEPSSTGTTPPDSSASETQDGAPPAKRARLDNRSDHHPTPSDSAASADQANANDSAPQSSSGPVQHNSFLTLPLELQAEILILTGSPQHVLAVARTCKVLCTTLLSPDAQFIWREARKGPGCTFEHTIVKHTLPLGHGGPVEETVTKVFATLPDLPKGVFSEAAYAAFVFDGGKCEFCDTKTSLSYASFALRTRICKNPQCANIMTSARFRQIFPHERNDPVLQLVPMNEGPFLTGRIYTDGTMWPTASLNYVRPEQVNAAATMLLPGIEDQEKIEKLKKRNEEWMKFSVELYKWNKLRVQQLNRMKDANLSVSKQIASSYGWEYDDLNNTVYGPYQLRKTKLIEKINEVDVRLMREQIESQLLALAERRQRRSNEISLMKNREDVETVYNRLRSTKAYPYMPSLPTFRKLPLIEMLQSEERPTTVVSVADTLQNDKVMKELLSSQLKRWVDKAKDDLGVALGFPKSWKNASKNILHPVERVTGRFLCKKCCCVEPKYRMDGCMDFAGACLHECVVGNKEKGRLRMGKKAIWDATNFVKDEKAINVLKASITALGHAEDRHAGSYLLKVGLAVVCMSCEPSMVLDSRSLIGHSHRHDNMKVSFALEDPMSYCGGFPYCYGLVQKLLGPLSFSVAGKREIDRKNYGCRHCLRQKQVTEAAAAAASSTLTHTSDDPASNRATEWTGAQNPLATPLPEVQRKANTELVELSAIVYQMHDLGVEGPLEKPPPLFNFNGMRSHLKAKHQIEEIRDEDMFCFRDPEITL